MRNHLQAALKGLGAWWTERAENLDVFDELEAERQKESPWWALGPIAYWFWIIVLVTGFWLVIYYIPTDFNAWTSVSAITFTVPWGGFIKSLHKYGADAFLIAMTMRVYRMYFTAEYRRPRELTYIVAVLLLVFGMFSGLTGYLLTWNQRAYWATKVFATFPTYLNEPYIPFLNIGRLISHVMLGGAAIGPATITRFYAGHYALSMILMILVEVHYQRRGLKRLNLSRFPLVLTFLLLVVTCWIQIAQTGRASEPSTTPERIFSDWYFLGLYHLYRLQDPFWATIITVILPPLAFVMAFVDRRGGTNPLTRPFTFVFGIYALVNWLGFSVLLCLNVADIKRDPKFFVLIAAAFNLFGAIWQTVYSAKKKEGRPFPEVMDLVALGWLFTFGIQLYHCLPMVTPNVLQLEPHKVMNLVTMGVTSFVMLGLCLYDIRRGGAIPLPPYRKRAPATVAPKAQLDKGYAWLYLCLFLGLMIIVYFGHISEF